MTSEESEQVGVVTRPRSVVWYERLAWTALVVGFWLLPLRTPLSSPTLTISITVL